MHRALGVAPDGKPVFEIGVHNGLLRRIPSEDQLAFVLGHELSHVLEDHLSQDLMKRHLNSQVNEVEADLKSLRMMKGKYNLEAAEKAFDIIPEFGHVAEVEEYFLSSHHHPSVRLAALIAERRKMENVDPAAAPRAERPLDRGRVEIKRSDRTLDLEKKKITDDFSEWFKRRVADAGATRADFDFGDRQEVARSLFQDATEKIGKVVDPAKRAVANLELLKKFGEKDALGWLSAKEMTSLYLSLPKGELVNLPERVLSDYKMVLSHQKLKPIFARAANSTPAWKDVLERNQKDLQTLNMSADDLGTYLERVLKGEVPNQAKAIEELKTGLGAWAAGQRQGGPSQWEHVETLQTRLRDLWKPCQDKLASCRELEKSWGQLRNQAARENLNAIRASLNDPKVADLQHDEFKQVLQKLIDRHRSIRLSPQPEIMKELGPDTFKLIQSNFRGRLNHEQWIISLVIDSMDPRHPPAPQTIFDLLKDIDHHWFYQGRPQQLMALLPPSQIEDLLLRPSPGEMRSAELDKALRTLGKIKGDRFVPHERHTRRVVTLGAKPESEAIRAQTRIIERYARELTQWKRQTELALAADNAAEILNSLSPEKITKLLDRLHKSQVLLEDLAKMNAIIVDHMRKESMQKILNNFVQRQDKMSFQEWRAGVEKLLSHSMKPSDIPAAELRLMADYLDRNLRTLSPSERFKIIKNSSALSILPADKSAEHLADYYMAHLATKRNWIGLKSKVNGSNQGRQFKRLDDELKLLNEHPDVRRILKENLVERMKLQPGQLGKFVEKTGDLAADSAQAALAVRGSSGLLAEMHTYSPKDQVALLDYLTGKSDQLPAKFLQRSAEMAEKSKYWQVPVDLAELLNSARQRFAGASQMERTMTLVPFFAGPTGLIAQAQNEQLLRDHILRGIAPEKRLTADVLVDSFMKAEGRSRPLAYAVIYGLKGKPGVPLTEEEILSAVVTHAYGLARPKTRSVPGFHGQDESSFLVARSSQSDQLHGGHRGTGKTFSQRDARWHSHSGYQRFRDRECRH
ncbi:MAG: hypothetical protein C5B49_04345 [Bdellovibrio sp.]|nr:MAG: hypothetical protein C5B49_04345 [Bdellovibrio sp.]